MDPITQDWLDSQRECLEIEKITALNQQKAEIREFILIRLANIVELSSDILIRRMVNEIATKLEGIKP